MVKFRAFSLWCDEGGESDKIDREFLFLAACSNDPLTC